MAASQQPNQGTDEPEKWAFLIGIDHYGHDGHNGQDEITPRLATNGNKISYKNLSGCVNDVLAVEKYLLDTIGVHPDCITKLLAPSPTRKGELATATYTEPTHANIVDTLHKVPKKAKRGDFVYIHYSGHGTQATTIFSDLKSPRTDKDEALVPSDITRGGKLIRDIELGVLLQAMVDAGLILTVVLDSCHSGGAVRGDDGQELGNARGVDDVYDSAANMDILQTTREFLSTEKERVLLWMKEPKGFVVLAACQYLQVARETRSTPSNGILTDCLLRTLREGPLDLSTQDLYGQVCTRVRDNPGDQKPFLVGDKDRFFFSRKLRSHEFSLRVSKALMRKDIRDSHVRLAGGEVHGVVKGSEYAILPVKFDLSQKIQDTDILARVRVATVGSEESTALFIEQDEVSWKETSQGCQAVLRKLPIEKQLTIHFIDERAREEFKTVHADNQAWLRLDEHGGNDAFYTIKVDEDGNFSIMDQPGHFTEAIQKYLPPLPAAAANSMPALIRRLEHLSKFRMVKKLSSPGVRVGSRSLMSVTVEPYAQGDVSPAHASLRRDDETGIYHVNEKNPIRIKIENKSGRTVGFVVMDCDAEFGVSKAWPYGAPYDVLSDKQHALADIFLTAPSKLNTPPFIDTIKVFVCDPAMDLSSLELPSLEGIEDDTEDGARNGGGHQSSTELANLLADLEKGRKAFPVRVEQEDWQVMDLEFQVHRPAH